MTDANYPSGTRRFSRITYHRPAVLDLKSARAECEVLDVSLKGAMVEVGPTINPQVGDTCALLIRLDSGGAQVRMDGEVVHVHGNKVGVKCDELDLDSIAHLRRLVELNVADDGVLQGELSALVAERDW
jgi:hypothetical protein